MQQICHTQEGVLTAASPVDERVLVTGSADPFGPQPLAWNLNGQTISVGLLQADKGRVSKSAGTGSRILQVYTGASTSPGPKIYNPILGAWESMADDPNIFTSITVTWDLSDPNSAVDTVTAPYPSLISHDYGVAGLYTVGLTVEVDPNHFAQPTLTPGPVGLSFEFSV